LKKKKLINAINAIHLINSKKKELISADNCQISIVTSIAGKIPSPLFALYAASKALLCSYISSVNIELAKKETKNRIIEIAPGYMEGTAFYGKKLNLDKLTSISKTILNEIENKKSLIIPQDKNMYLEILERAHNNPLEFGNQSYDYKLTEIKKRT
jgi:short-subunit dehydrogenase